MTALVLDKSSKGQVRFCLKRANSIFSTMLSMTNNEELAFNEALCARVHRLRNERGYTSAQMATALGCPADRYRKYEYRSPLPAYLMERFCIVAGCDLEHLITGKLRKARKTAVNEELLRA